MTKIFDRLARESVRHALCERAARFIFFAYRGKFLPMPVPIEGMYSPRRVLSRTTCERSYGTIPIVEVRLRKKAYYESYCDEYAQQTKRLLQAQTLLFEEHDPFYSSSDNPDPLHIIIDRVDVSGEDVVIFIVFLNRENSAEYFEAKGGSKDGGTNPSLC